MMLTSFSGGMLSVFDLVLGKKLFSGERSVPQLSAFPVSGALLGIFFSAAAWTLRTLTGTFPGSVLSALFIVLALEIACDWKRLCAVTETLSVLFSGKSFLTALFAEEKSFRRITPVFLFITLFIIRILCAGVIVHRGECFSFILVFTTSFLLCGLWLSEAVEEDDDFPGSGKARALLAAGVILIFSCFLSFRLNAFAHLFLTAAAASGIFLFFRKQIRNAGGSVNQRMLSSASFASETLLLLTALIG